MGCQNVLPALVTNARRDHQIGNVPIESEPNLYCEGLAEQDTRVLTLAALKGALGAVVHEPVTFVNAPTIARERGIAVSETRSAVSRDYVNLMTLRGQSDDHVQPPQRSRQ